MPAASMEKVAVLSSNGGPSYALITPLTSHLWSSLVGYRPFVYFVGKVPPLVVEKTAETKAIIRHVAPHARVGTARVSQDVRLFAAREGCFSDETYLLMTDADMWPLQRGY